jgi:outer membrane receptor protein involved in Fe transport
MDDISVFGLTVNANVNFADLTTATAYWSRLGVQTQDASESIYVANGGAAPFVANGYTERDPSHQISQEVRLTSHDSGGYHWVAGAFYSELHSVWNEIGENPAIASPAVPDGSYFISWNPYTVKQTALFADGSYKFTDHWKLSAGVRWYTYKSEQDEYSWGFDGPNLTPPPASLVTTASDRGFNPRVTLSYLPDPDLTTYATVSKGFRPAVAVRQLRHAQVRSGFGVELRVGREGQAVRQLADHQQRLLLHQVGWYPTGAHAAVRLPVLQQCG